MIAQLITAGGALFAWWQALYPMAIHRLQLAGESQVNMLTNDDDNKDISYIIIGINRASI